MNDLEKLLSEVQKCVDRDNQIKTEQFQRGERFNVFDVLGVSTKETQTHSAFLAELLRPQGSHGCGAALLKIFLQKCGLPEFSAAHLLSAKVETEHYIGSVDLDKNEGGREDIRIRVEDWLVVVENKIYAGDQPAQIQRYHNDVRSTPNFKIIYLTLDGHDASEYSNGGQLKADKDYFLMSYEKDILDFIRQSIHATIQKPLVRETLVQYSDLIKQLTHQDMDDRQEQEMFEAMAEHADAVARMFEVGSEKYVQWAYVKYVRPHFVQFAKENGFEFKEANDLWTTRQTGFYFYKPEWKAGAIYIWKDGGGCPYYSGVSNRLGEPMEQLNLPENILPMYSKKPTPAWPLGWGTLEKYAAGDASIVPAMKSGEYAAYIEGLVKEIYQQIQEKNIALP